MVDLEHRRTLGVVKSHSGARGRVRSCRSVGLQRLFYEGLVKRYCEARTNPSERDPHDRAIIAPADHRRHPARYLGGPLSRRDRRLRHLAGGRQRGRCRGRRRDRARRAAERTRRCCRGRADHDLPRREARGRDDRRARHLAEGARPAALHARARRQDPARRVAHRRAGGARCLDHRAAALRHDELWRGRGRGDPPGARRFPDVPADGREPQAARSRAPRLAVDGGDLPAERQPPEAGEVFRQTDLGASLQYMADEERRRRAAKGAAARPGSKRRATPSIAATSPARSSPS